MFCSHCNANANVNANANINCQYQLQALGVGEPYVSDVYLDVDQWYHIAAVWRADGTATLFLNTEVCVCLLPVCE